MKIKVTIKAALVWACTFFCLLPSTAHSEYNFLDKPLTIERKYGDSIEVQKIEFVGSSRIHYTTPEGKDGYLGETNIKNLQDLYHITGRTPSSPRKPQKTEPAISSQEYTEKIYRLDREIKEERLGGTHVTKNISKKTKPTLSAQEAGELSLSQIQEQIEEQIEEIEKIYSLPVAEIIQ